MHHRDAIDSASMRRRPSRRHSVRALAALGIAWIGLASLPPGPVASGDLPQARAVVDAAPDPAQAGGHAAKWRAPVTARAAGAPRGLPAGPAQQPRQLADRASVGLWMPQYTSFLLLTYTDDLITLVSDDDTLWLATERSVATHRHGVWSPPELVADDAMVLALAPLGDSGDALAFGYEGGAWQRRDGRWSAMTSPTPADLYDAVSRDSNDVWAVGFDYDTQHGVVVRFDGYGLTAASWPWLYRRQLLTIAGPPGGELWAGGCDGNDAPFLMRDGGSGDWRPFDAPDVAGCVEHLAFSPDGRGLAAVDGDLLWFDGVEWIPYEIAPPADASWVRVAFDTLELGADGAAYPSADGPHTVTPPLAWAIPGEPTWRGYIDGGAPWHFDGLGWTEAPVDYRGYDALFVPSDTNPNAQPFIDLAATPAGPVAVCRTGGTPGIDRRAGIVVLDDEVARLEHPLIFGLGGTTDDALRPAGGADVHLVAPDLVIGGARIGPAPLIEQHGGDRQWSVAPGAPAERGRSFWVDLLDFSGPDHGWALGGAFEEGGGYRSLAWRRTGGTWQDVPPPPTQSARALTQLRALPDGRAWALTSESRLYEFARDAWTLLDEDSPAIGPAWAADGHTQVAALRAPFDAAAVERTGEVVPWAASREQLDQSVGRAWQAVQTIPRGFVLDLQMVDARSGWAIAIDTSPGGSRVPGVLLRLVDRRWTEVDPGTWLRQALAARAAAGDASAAAIDQRYLRWWLMSAVDADEVWLYGTASLTGRPQWVTLLLRLRLGVDGGPRRAAELQTGCSINALSAHRVAGGTDVWIMGRDVCGPAVTAVAEPYAGPISVLRVRDAVGEAWLPSVGR